MANPAWTYSDWITLSPGSSERLTRLRLHIQEVSDRISTGNYANPKGSHDKDALQRELESLRKIEKDETAASAALTGRGVSFTRAKLL